MADPIVEEYGVLVSDVTGALPTSIRNIGPDTYLSTGMLEGFIGDGASEVTSALTRRGINPQNLTGEALRQVRTRIVWYAVKEALLKLGYTGQEYREAKSKWEDALNRLKAEDGEVAGQSTPVHANAREDKDLHLSDNFIGKRSDSIF